MFDGIKVMARKAGRDPGSLALLVRGNDECSDVPLGQNRGDFTGMLEQITADTAATRKLGAAELVLDVQSSPDVKILDQMLARVEQLRNVAH